MTTGPVPGPPAGDDASLQRWMKDVYVPALPKGVPAQARTGSGLSLDPLAVPSELEDVAAGRETAIVLTAPWHERDAQSLVERLGVPVYTPLPDSAQYLMDTYGLTAEQAGDGSPDVVWLLREKKGEARPYSPGDRLPFGAGPDRVLHAHLQR